MRTYLMAGNWKMNKTIPETVVLTQQLCNQYNRKWDNVDIVLCPPAIDIKAAYTVLDFDKTNISLGAAGIVDSNDIEGRILLHRAENKSADTTEAVDTNLGCHEAPLSCLI